VAHDGRRSAASGGAIEISPGTLAKLDPESVAWIVKVKLPALVGVPDIDPSDPRVSPAGSAPEVTVHV